MSRSKRQSSSDEAGTAGELRRFMMQGMAWAWEFSLFEESLSLEAQDPLYRTVPEGCSSHSEYNPGLPCHLQEKDTTKLSLDCLFKRVDRSKSSKKPEPVPSTSGMNEIVACPVLPIADNPSAVPSPISSTPFSSSSSLFTRCQFLFASHCTVLLYLSGYCTVSLKLFIFPFNVLFVWKVL